MTRSLSRAVSASSLIRFAALVLALVASCAAPPVDAPAPAKVVTSQLIGKVFLQGPVVGATVRVLDGTGKVLKEAPASTNANGVFDLEVAGDLPPLARVTVTGGTVLDKADGDVVLAADVVSSTASPAPVRVVFVNAVTTLAAQYRDKKTTVSSADADVAVRKFLMLPSTLDFGYGLASKRASIWFNHTKFAADAGAAGLRPFLAQLATDMVAGAAPRSFGQKLLGSASSSILKFVGQKVAGGIISSLTGDAMGWAMDELGLGFPDKSDAERAAILKAVQDVSTQLADVQGEVAELNTKLDALVPILKTQITDAVELASYEDRAGQLSTLQAVADDGMNQLSIQVEKGAAFTVAGSDAFTNDVKLHYGAYLIDYGKRLVGYPGAEGMIPLMKRVVGRNYPGYPVVDNSYLAPLSNLYQFHYGEQLKLLICIVEAYHAETPANTSAAQKYLDIFNTNIAAQRALLEYDVLPSDDLLLDVAGHVVWSKSMLGGSPWTPPGSTSQFFYRMTDFDTGTPYPDGDPATLLAAWSKAGISGWRLPTFAEVTTSMPCKLCSFAQLKAIGFTFDPTVTTILTSTLGAGSAFPEFYLVGDGAVGYGTNTSLFSILPVKDYPPTL